jgi:hypothetical protein
MEEDRTLDLGRHPHAAPGAMLLEVAFVHAPEFNAPTPGQAMQFFKRRDLVRLGLGDLRLGLAQPESHGAKKRWHWRAPRSAGADAPRAVCRPTDDQHDRISAARVASHAPAPPIAWGSGWLDDPSQHNLPRWHAAPHWSARSSGIQVWPILLPAEYMN